MKQYSFITVIFLVMVVAILLASCGTAPIVTPEANKQTLESPTQAVVPSEQPVTEQAQPAAAATSQPDTIIPVTSASTAPAVINAEVTADVLNVRVGPGINHQIMAQLVAGQVISVQGRSQTSEWMAIRLADGREGWVYSSYLSPSADLTSLPVMEAYGGPVISTPEVSQPSKPSGRYLLNVSISYNQADVRMSGFAGERDMTLRLVVPGEGRAMTVASTKTDAAGSATLIFTMPTSWPDGSAVTQSEMELQVLGLDGTIQGKARIYYQWNG